MWSAPSASVLFDCDGEVSLRSVRSSMSKVGLGMVLLGLWTTGVVGCGEGNEPDYVGREAYCDGLCAAAERCGSNPDREWCFDACLSNS